MYEKKMCDERNCNVDYWISDNPPDDIVLRGFVVVQKNRTFYITKVSAQELDRLCYVPRIDATQPNSELSRIALIPSLDRWQRTINLQRVADIGTFFNHHRNFFVNSVIISLPADVPRERVDEIVEFSIPTTWMKKECSQGHKLPIDGVDYWFERCPNHDCPDHGIESRPGEIIDGQHRIRGTQHRLCSSAYRIEPLVATVLLDDEFPPEDEAKIFTEITTAAEDLEPLHKTFLLFKFHMRGPPIQAIRDADFTTITDLGKRNRLAYTICCHLNSATGPWSNRISILRLPGRSGGRMRRGDVIEIPWMVSILEEWLRPSGVFFDVTQNSMRDLLEIVHELDDYLKATLQTWSGIRFWNNTRSANGILQGRGIFWVILHLFETLARRIDSRGVQRAQPEFEKELQLISPIDWGSDWTAFEAPDRNRQLLHRILRHKIESSPIVGSPQFSPDTSLNTYITQPPDAFDWNQNTMNLNGQTITSSTFLEWTPPINAYPTGRLHIYHNGILISDTEVKGATNEFDPSALTITGQIRIETVYSNPRGVTIVSTPLTLII